MFRLMTSILTAAFVTSLIAGAVPAQDPDTAPEFPKAKAAGPVNRQSPSPSDKTLSPSEAASHVGQRVTVEFTVTSTGTNPAGFLELYSGRTWQEEGAFFIRFSDESQKKFKKLNIPDVRTHFKGTTVRVSGEVNVLASSDGPRAVIYVEDVTQIEVVNPSGGAAAPGVRDEGAFFNPDAPRAAKEIKEIERRFKTPFVIETFKNIPAERMEKFKAIDRKDTKATSDFFFGWAVDRWKAVGVNSIYVLICKEPSNIQPVTGSGTAKKVFTASDRKRLLDVLAKGFREANTAEEETEKQQIYDKALLDAVALVRERLESNLNPPRLVHNQMGYMGSVLFSHDDKELITTSNDNTIRVWDVQTLTELEVVRPPRHGQLYRSALSPDGRQLAISSGDLVYLVARSGWKIEHVLTGHKGIINRLAFSADGERLASSSDEKTVRIWATRVGKCERILEGHTDTVCDVAFAPDGSRLVTGSEDGIARIWSLKTGETEAVLQGHPKGTVKVAWSPDGKILATGGKGELRLWNADGTLRITLGNTYDYFSDLQFTSDSRRVIFTEGGDKSLFTTMCMVIDVDSGGAVAGLGYPRASAEPHTALSRDGKLAMTDGAAGFGWILWTVADGQIVRNRTYGTVSPGYEHPIRARSGKGGIVSVGWSPEGNPLIAIGQSEMRVGPNDLGPLERSFDLANLDWGPAPTQAFRRAQEVRDSRSLILEDKETVIVKHSDGRADVKLSFKDEGQTVFCYTLLPENRAAIGTRRFAFYIMDTITGKKISSHWGHDATVSSLAPSPDDQYLLTSDGGTIRVWRQTPTRLLLSFCVDGDDWIAWTPDGYFAASPGGERLMGWEVSNGPDQMASFYAPSRFRKSLCRPDVIQRLLKAGSVEQALAEADAKAGTSTKKTEVAQTPPPTAATSTPPPEPLVPSSDETGFQPLFNGKDLAGWVVDGGDGHGWRVEGGEIVASGEGTQSSDFLLSDREYRNFSLRFEFKVGENAQSGVGVRALRGERVNGRPMNLEVQIHDDEGLPAGEGETTGSLLWNDDGRLMKPTKVAQRKRRGEWNTMEVVVRSLGLGVAVNGEYVLALSPQVLLMDPRVLAGVGRDQGRIGFQRHTGEVRFRNIRIKELAPQLFAFIDAGGHISTVRGAVFTKDGRQLITASLDKAIRVWDVKTGASVRVLRPPPGRGRIGEHFSVALSPDGKTLAVGGAAGRIFLIDLPSGRMLHFLVGHSNSVIGLDFSPDGTRLATSSADKTVRIWDVATGQTIRTLTGHSAFVYAVRFSPDGRLLATGAGDKTARIFSADDGSLTATINANAAVTSVDWSQDGKTLFTSDLNSTQQKASGFVCQWRLDGTQLKRFEAPGAVSSLHSTKDGAILYTWNKAPKREGGAVILDVESGQPRATFDKSSNSILCSALSPDGRLAATAGFDAADVRIWRTDDGQQLHQLRAQGSRKLSAGWTADGTSIAWGNQPYTDRPSHINNLGPLIHTFDLKTLQMANPTSGFQVGSLTLGDLRIEKGSPAVILIKRGDEVVKEIDTKPLGGEWRSAAWVDRDRIIVGTLVGDVALVDANTGKLKRRFIGHVGTIWAVSPSPDRRHFLTASQDSTLRIWSLDSPFPILTLYFTDEGEWIAGAGKGYYAASPGGEGLMGWGVENGLKAMASFYPSSQFRKTLYRPDVIKRLIDVGSLDQALAAADAAAGKSTKQTDIERILPPTIFITKPASSPVKMTVKTLEIEAVARSYGANPVTEMRLMLDDRPVPDAFKSFDSPRLWEASATFTVEVPPGNHRLTVQASNAASKAVADPVEVVGVGGGEDGAQRSGTLYVLAIGINDYPDKRLKLDCAAPDAQALRQVFLTHSRRLFRDVEARLLLDRQATRAEMLGGMQWLGGKVKAGDVAVVFYAGHGYCSKEGVFYLVPVDANLRDLSATGISGEALEKSIGELPCTTVLILDACYAASIGAKKRKTRALPVESDTVLRHLIYDSGLVVMCAAYKDQEAAEENGHGFFTQAIVEGLEGKADKYKTGRVEVDDLQTYVKHRVRELSDNEQEPTIGIPPTVRSFALSQQTPEQPDR